MRVCWYWACCLFNLGIKLRNGLKSLSPLWDLGTNCRQPFSRVQSSSGIHKPKALGGSVYRKVESRWGKTVKRNISKKKENTLKLDYVNPCLTTEFKIHPGMQYHWLCSNDYPVDRSRYSSVYFGFCSMKSLVRSMVVIVRILIMKLKTDFLYLINIIWCTAYCEVSICV